MCISNPIKGFNDMMPGVRPVKPIPKKNKKIIDQLSKQGVDVKSEEGRKIFEKKLAEASQEGAQKKKKKPRLSRPRNLRRGGKGSRSLIPQEERLV